MQPIETLWLWFGPYTADVNAVPGAVAQNQGSDNLTRSTTTLWLVR